MSVIPASRAVVEILRAEKVRTVFGLPGGHIIGILDALFDCPDIRFIRTRHEHAAAHLAVAQSQLTREPAVCLVGPGPAATNLLTGIAEAFHAALPVVVLAGRGRACVAHRGDSQTAPTELIFAPVTKWAVRVERAELIPEILRRAFHLARSGRPGPVLVDLPADLLNETIPWQGYHPAPRPAVLRGALDAIVQAAQSLTAAWRPLIVAGGGVLAAGAWTEVTALAERLCAPVLTSLSGRTSIPDDHPLSAGGLGIHSTPLSQRLLNEADVVLSLGCRFEAMETNWETDFLPAADAQLIQVDIEAAEIGRSIPASLGIVGDIRSVCADLLDELGADRRARGLDHHPRVIRLRQEVAALDATAAAIAASDERPLHPLRVVRAARSVFPRESTVMVDIGALAQQISGAFPWFRLYEPRSLIAASSFYGMGDAAAGLPAARLVHPERAAVGFVGDGSFQMMMDVLPVAAEYRLGVTWCILNDAALGSIWDIQDGRLDGRILATRFEPPPDFAKLGEACGCHGERVEMPAEIEPALRRALEANQNGRPAVLDFIVARRRTRQTAKFFGLRAPGF